MNYTSKVNPRNKGKILWKRNANTSQTNRKSAALNHKNMRLNSESSNYSYFPQTQLNFHLNSTSPVPYHKFQDWNQIKSIAKHSTIASRIELKKSVPISLLQKSYKKTQKIEQSRVTSKNNSFSRVIDKNGNITHSFKQSSEFKSINPHIPKDVDKIRKKTFNIYKKEKRMMDQFLGQDSEMVTMATQDEERVNSRAKSLLISYSKDSQMQKISQRQEYQSRMNSTRMKKDKKKQSVRLEKNEIDNEIKISDEKRMKETSQEAIKYMEEQHVRGFVKSRQRSVYEHFNQKKQKSSHSPQNSSNVLLRGLLGEYSNYEKMSKHELIQKLISLEYLAQNIFKKNKHLERQLRLIKMQQCPLQMEEFREQCTNKSHLTQNEKFKIGENGKMINDRETKIKDVSNLKECFSQRNLFVIDNEDGYFNQFLESEKGKDNEQVMVELEDSKRSREDP